MEAAYTEIANAASQCFGNIGGSVSRVQDAGELTTGYFSGVEDLKSYIAKSDTDMMLLHLPGLVDKVQIIPRFTFQTTSQSLSVMAVRFPVNGIPNLNNPSVLIVLACPKQFCTYMRGVKFKKEVRLMGNPPDAFNGMLPNYLPPGGRELVQKTPVYVMSGQDSDIVRLFETPGIPMEDKTRAVLFHMYPYLRDAFRNDYFVMSYEEMCNEKGATGIDKSNSKDDIRRMKFLWLTAMCLLGPFYSQAAEMANQIYKRGKAATQSLGLDWGTPEAFNAYKEEHGVVPKDRSPLLDLDLGRWLALTKEYKHDPSVTKNGLAELDDIQREFKVEPWAISLLGQGRMVGAKAHAVTLGFAISAEVLVRHMCPNLGGDWLRQSNELRALADKSQNQPYCGLVKSLPEPQQINNWPDFAYLGGLHYRACLSRDQQEKFDAGFKLSNIANHLANDAAKYSCEELAKILPTNNIIGVSRLIQNIPLSQARVLMDHKPEEEKILVLKYLDTLDIKGKWHEYYKNVLAAKELTRIRDIASGAIKETIKEKMDAAINATEDIVDKTQRKIAKAEINDWAREKYKALAGDDPIGTKVGKPKMDMLTAVTRDEVQRLTDLMNNIIKEVVWTEPE